MKKFLAAFFVLFVVGQLKAQDIAGSWVGAIHVGGTELHLVFNI